MKIFHTSYFDALATKAQGSPRHRQHLNIHTSYQDSCQRLFNAIEPDSYIRPHRHKTDPKDELLIAVRGVMALITFNDMGRIAEVIRFGSEKYGNDIALGVEVSPYTWHTVIAVEPNSVLLEVKAGPFDPTRPKDLAHWAPEEDDAHAKEYLVRLFSAYKKHYPNLP